MSATVSLFKTLFVPAFISLGIFTLITYFVVPLWQRHRARYSRYLPLDAINTQTNGLRHRIQAAALRVFLPSTWRQDFSGRNRFADEAEDTSDTEDGEELYEIDERRREAISLDARRGQDEDRRRLSRDLEEGFRDDSDEDTPTVGNQNR